MKAGVLCAILVGCSSLWAHGQTTRPSDGFEVREWAVFVVDAAQNQMNPAGDVQSTMPDFVGSDRDADDAQFLNQPQPIAVIRLIGSSPDSTVDVMVTKSDGSFETSWPKAESRSTQLLWRDLKLSPQIGDQKLQDVPPGHWFNDLRSAASDYLSQADGPTERFLSYDVQMPYPCPLKVTHAHAFTLDVKNDGGTTLHNVTFYKGDSGAWREAFIGDLESSSHHPAPATTQSTTQPTTHPTTQPTTRPASYPPTQPAANPSPISLKPVAATQPSDLAADWKPKLLDAGLDPADADVIVKIIARSAFDPRRLTAIYFLDGPEFDRLLPLEIVPDPKSIVRVGIVIVRNADPAAGTDIDDLIAQLGDPVWAKREAASKALQKIGKAALPKLQEATHSKDVEVVWRAERLINANSSQSP